MAVRSAAAPDEMKAAPGPRPRLEAADALRALATVLVVVIHTTHWPHRAALFDDLDLLSRLAVPAFMVLTGALLAYQYFPEPAAPLSFLRRRFSRSLLPWLVWAPVYAVTGWFFTGDVTHDGEGLQTFFTYGAGHLWYLLLIPQMYLVYLVWPRRRLWLWAAAAVVVQTALAVYRLYGSVPGATLSQLTLWHGFQLLPFWIGYFAVGLAAGGQLADRGQPAAGNRIATWVAAVATLAGGVLLIGMNYNNAPNADFQHGTGAFLLPQEPLFVLSAAALVVFAAPAALLRMPKLARVTRVLSENSLGIYILHPLLIYPIARLMQGALFTGLPLSLLGFVALTVTGLAAATGLSLLLSTTPLGPTLGVRRRDPERSRLTATH